MHVCQQDFCADTVLVNGKWLQYADAVKTVDCKEEQYMLLETLLEASRQQYVPDDLTRSIKTLVNKMF